nr:MAG TPA: hypothetical protein [Caudoviricetes sp.]
MAHTKNFSLRTLELNMLLKLLIQLVLKLLLEIQT